MKLLVLLIALPLLAADPPAFGAWNQAALQTRVMAAKLDAHQVGLESMGNWGNHSLELVHRAGNGQAEVHSNRVDIITVLAGEGTLIIGGTMVEARTTGTGEIRGKSITGGTSHKMAPGDVFHIPAKLPHQMLVPKSLVFQVVKVTSR